MRSATAIALVGGLLFVAGMLFANWQRASAASCWDPTLGWRCSQSAGSDAIFLANVSTIMAFVGLGIAVVAVFAILWIANDPRYRAFQASPVPVLVAHACPRCRQALVWSPVDGRWYCPWCGLLA